jgi:hypothetical protein
MTLNEALDMFADSDIEHDTADLYHEPSEISEAILWCLTMVAIRQNISFATHSYGYKMWYLNSPICPSGYLVQYEPYQGAGTAQSNHPLGIGGSVVMDLIKELPPKTYHLMLGCFVAVVLF